MDSATDAILSMVKLASPEKAAGMRRFFKTGKGQYAEGDRFLGLPNPIVRSLTKRFAALPLSDLRALLDCEFHESRLCALLIMAAQFRNGDADAREALFSLYREKAPTRINNWDLVDLSAPDIAGAYEKEHRSGVLDAFAASGVLWEQRIAVVGTLTFIRNGDFAPTLRLCEKFLTHRHDLMHKACGWMLREVGKRDRGVLTRFLNRFKAEMPRTMLRYAIEHYPEEQRRDFLACEKNPFPSKRK